MLLRCWNFSPREQEDPASPTLLYETTSRQQRTSKNRQRNPGGDNIIQRKLERCMSLKGWGIQACETASQYHMIARIVRQSGQRRYSKNKGCQGMGASSKGADGIGQHQSAPKGCARDGISTGLRGTPERYRVMVPGESTGAGNARYLSGFRYECRKHYSASGCTRFGTHLPPKHITSNSWVRRPKGTVALYSNTLT